MARIKEMDTAGRFDLFVDLHNPGAGSKQPFYFIPPDQLLTNLGKKNLDRFFQASRAEITGPFALSGKLRVAGPKYDKAWKKISKNWVVENTNKHVVAVCLETAWNTPHSTTEGYRQVGRQLGLAILRYLETNHRPVSN